MEGTHCSRMSRSKRLGRSRWFGKIVSLLLILGSLKRRRRDGISFLEITCHVRLVSGYLVFPSVFA